MANYGGQQQTGYGSQQPYVAAPTYAPAAPHVTTPLTTGAPSDLGGTIKGERFGYSESEYRDKIWAILFVLHLLGMIACGVLYVPGLWEEQVDDGSATSSLTEQQFIEIGWMMAVTLITAGLVGAMWLSVMQKYADTIIKISLFTNTALLMVVGAYCFYLGVVFAAVIYWLFAGLTLLYYYLVRRRIPFTQAILASSTEAIKANPGVVSIAYLFCFLQIVWFIGWSFIAAAVYDNYTNYEQESSGGLIFVLLVSFYWTSQVLINLSHVTTAGVVASWWFQPANNAPVSGACKRATTTSFGSICLGSLIVAVLKAAYTMVREAQKQENNFIRCIAACLLNCLERMIQYFNMYAYTQVAIYGKDFITAAKHTWELFVAKGFQIIINDDLTGMVLTMGCFIGGVVAGIAGYIISSIIYDDETVNFVVLLGGFFIGFFVVSVIMNVVQSAVCTTFVVWAEDPGAMSQTRPMWFKNIREARDHMYPGRFRHV